MNVSEVLIKIKKYGVEIEKLNNSMLDHPRIAAKVSFDDSAYAEGSVLYNKKDVQRAIDSIGVVIDHISNGGGTVTWGGVTSKPFSSIGSTLDTTAGVLNVKDGLYSPNNHKHPDYAPISHSSNNNIHVNSADKTNINKVPDIEKSIENINSLLANSTRQFLVKTLAERDALENLRHCDICHVTDVKKSFIYEKVDINGNEVSPEWIPFADFSVVKATWVGIEDKPFATVGNGLTVSSNNITINFDPVTMEIVGGKLKVKSNVYADKEHSHTINYSSLVGKPALYKEIVQVNTLTQADELYKKTISHNLACDDLVIKVFGQDKQERLVGVEQINNNSFILWTDTSEILNVTVYTMK